MDKITIQDIPIEYRIPLVGKYNAGCSRCYSCLEWLGANDALTKTTLIGFAESHGDVMQIHECLQCFKKQRFHVKTKAWLESLLLQFELLKEKNG
jgi:hypothetical protein